MKKISLFPCFFFLLVLWPVTNSYEPKWFLIIIWIISDSATDAADTTWTKKILTWQKVIEVHHFVNLLSNI